MQENELKVVTYNIQGHAASRRSDHVPNLAAVIAAMNPDIVGLQEVHCNTRAFRGDQARQIAELTGLNLAFGRSCGMDGGDYGNAILTRGKILSTSLYPLPGSGEPRSVMQADVEVRGLELSFFVTHLAAWGRLLRVQRLRQVGELGDIIARGSLPHILAGDFNVAPGAEELQQLLSHGHLRACGEPGDVTFPMMRQRLDYVFCDPRWTFLSSEVIRQGPSDHWPVVVDLAMQSE